MRNKLHSRTTLRVMAAVGGVVGGVTLLATPAFATSITTPSTNPIVVTADGSGNPQAFTVVASGFTAGQQVYIEQCDGVSSTTSGYDPTAECDLGSSPAAAIADGSGNVTFSSTDINHKFTPFRGSSPQGLFNCLAPGDPASNNGLTDYTNCQIRVSTNNGGVTSDQVFKTLTLPAAVTPPPAAPEVPYAVLLPLGALGVGGGYLVVRKRRSAQSAAA